MELWQKSATELADLLDTRQVSAGEVCAAFWARIDATEPTLGAFLRQNRAAALQQAEELDSRLAASAVRKPLEGLPIGLKDNICTKDIPTTCASRMLAGFVPPYSATVAEKLDEAGAVLLGKLNMDEFAMGSSCENSAFQQTRNPWDTTRVPGGSSGGAAAAVAVGQLPWALGSDTGGSVRAPAAFCGVLGLRPTYGAVSRYGLVAFASSLDQIGPMARTVDDLALLYAAISGADAGRDATSCAVEHAVPPEPSVKGMRLGVPAEYFTAAVDAEVRQAVEKAIRQLESAGALVVETHLPATPHALAAYYVISSAEASSNLARYDGIRYGAAPPAGAGHDPVTAARSAGFGDEVKRRILLGTHVLSSASYDKTYRRAKLLQRQIAAEFETAFARCDLLLTPAMPTPAFALGEKLHAPMQMYQSDICVIPASLAGLPALSIPCGFSGGGLPIGMQAIGPRFAEARLFALAKAWETMSGGFPMQEGPL